MLHRLVLAVAATFLIACIASSCNGGGGANPILNPQDETRIILASGGGAIFPAGAFTETTEVDVNEDLTGPQTSSAAYPADSGDMLGSTTVKVPAGVMLNSDIQVLIALSPAQSTNLAFTIFMFNPTSGMWETTAAASSASKVTAAMGMITDGDVASFTASTAGTTGFEATYGVFENYNEDTGGGTTNTIPTVSLSADSTSVDPDVTVNLTATGSDADGDTLTYSWMAAGGTLDSTGDVTANTWSSSDGGAYTVSVSVNDGNGGVASDSVLITVSTPGPPPPVDDPPAFEDGDITGDVAAPVVGQRVWLTAPMAVDPEGLEVSYAWSGDGAFADPTVGEEGVRVFWTPDADGSMTATCTASDPGGNEDTKDFSIDVAPYPAPADFAFVGYPTCLGCHPDKGNEDDGTGWFSTRHHDAIQRQLGPDNAHGYRNPSCYNCHALGWEPNDEGQGFIDIDLTPELGNIQCESCHRGGNPQGMGPGHKAVPWNPLTGMMYDEENSTWVPDPSYDGANGYGCGDCHEGSRHGAVEEWVNSVHGSFTNTEDDGGTLVPHHKLTGSSCAKCHNGQEYVRVQIDGEDPGDIPEYTLDDLPNLYISCATCHDPHDAQYEAQLRVDSQADVIIPWDDTPVNGGLGNVCISCHNGRRTRDDYDSQMDEGSSHFGPHHNVQGPILFGLMGADLGNPPATVDYDTGHPHREWNDNTCTTCHMYRRAYIDADNPVEFGHTFEPRFERCITCHTNWNADQEEEFWTWVEDFQSETEALAQDFLDAWPAAWKDGDGVPVSVETNPGDGDGPPASDPVGNAYRAALWNYYLVEDDGSMGVHNPNYVKSLLEEATAALDALPDP